MRVEKEWGLCFVGFGNVGQGLARLLVKKEEELASRWGFSCRTLAVVGKTKGALVRPEGIGMANLLARVGRGNPWALTPSPRWKRRCFREWTW